MVAWTTDKAWSSQILQHPIARFQRPRIARKPQDDQRVASGSKGPSEGAISDMEAASTGKIGFGAVVERTPDTNHGRFLR